MTDPKITIMGTGANAGCHLCQKRTACQAPGAVAGAVPVPSMRHHSQHAAAGQALCVQVGTAALYDSPVLQLFAAV